MVHSGNRLSCAITLTLFATGIALSVVLIAIYSRPFTGEVPSDQDCLNKLLLAKSRWKARTRVFSDGAWLKSQNRISAISGLSRMTIQSMRADRAPHAHLLDQRDWNFGQMDNLHGD